MRGMFCRRPGRKAVDNPGSWPDTVWKQHQILCVDLGSANSRRQALPGSEFLCIAND